VSSAPANGEGGRGGFPAGRGGNKEGGMRYTIAKESNLEAKSSRGEEWVLHEVVVAGGLTVLMNRHKQRPDVGKKGSHKKKNLEEGSGLNQNAQVEKKVI